MFISLANMHMKCICQDTKNLGRNDCNKKREDSTEADGLGDTQLNPNSSLPATKCHCAMIGMKGGGIFFYLATA